MGETNKKLRESDATIGFGDQENENFKAEPFMLTAETLRQQENKKRVVILFICSFSLATINYFGTSIISLSSQENASYFGKADMTASFKACLSIFGLISQFLYSTFFMKIKHFYKMTFVSLLSAFVFFIIYLNFEFMPRNWGLWVMMLMSSILGCNTVIGSNTIVGFMKTFPPESVSGFSSGMGFCGLICGILYLSLKAFIPFKYICLLIIPLYILYMIAFFSMIKIKSDVEHIIVVAEKEGRIIIDNDEERYSDSIEDDPNQHISKEVMIKNVEEQEAKINNNLSVKDFMAVFTSVGWIIFNISFCYFLKYLGMVSFADKATKMI